jgi:RNA recognition motif-containing protein
MSFIKKSENDYNDNLISLKELDEMRIKYANLNKVDKLILDNQSIDENPNLSSFSPVKKKLNLSCTECNESFNKIGLEEDFKDRKGVCSNCKSGNKKFSNKDPKYKAIKITNIVLFIVFYFLEIIAQEAQCVRTPNAAPVIITFFFSRYFIRKMFSDNPDFDYKILKTIGVWIGVMIIKAVLGFIILSLILQY